MTRRASDSSTFVYKPSFQLLGRYCFEVWYGVCELGKVGVFCVCDYILFGVSMFGILHIEDTTHGISRFHICFHFPIQIVFFQY